MREGRKNLRNNFPLPPPWGEKRKYFATGGKNNSCAEYYTPLKKKANIYFNIAAIKSLKKLCDNSYFYKQGK